MPSSEQFALVKSSAPYQIILYFNFWYIALFFSIEIGTLIWKGVSLPYIDGVLALEIVFIVILTILAFIQIYFGYRGNQLEDGVMVVISLLMLLPLLGGVLYFLLWQSYVMWLEVIVTSIELFFLGAEILFSAICIITFSRSKSKTA